jgi:hypothetical protein
LEEHSCARKGGEKQSEARKLIKFCLGFPCITLDKPPCPAQSADSFSSSLGMVQECDYRSFFAINYSIDVREAIINNICRALINLSEKPQRPIQCISNENLHDNNFCMK